MLTDEQRAELEALGSETVRAKLIQLGAGRDASLSGFKTGIHGGLTRGDVEDWLVEKHIEEAHRQRSTLRWAKIGGRAAVVGAIAAVVGAGISIWLAFFK